MSIKTVNHAENVLTDHLRTPTVLLGNNISYFVREFHLLGFESTHDKFLNP